MSALRTFMNKNIDVGYLSISFTTKVGLPCRYSVSSSTQYQKWQKLWKENKTKIRHVVAECTQSTLQETSQRVTTPL